MRQLKITTQYTNRDSKSIDRFLQEIGHEDLLTADEEVELAQKIKKGDQRALNRLVKCNLRFVVSVAKQYQNQGIDLEDLINEGNMGLIKAAQKFDETRGFKFISYAVWWIRQSIMQAIAEQGRVIRLPLNQVGNVNKLKREINRFEQIHERQPSPEELVENIHLPEDKILEAFRISGRHTSIDAPFAEGEDNSLLDILVNTDSPLADNQLVMESLQDEIDRALNCLSQREQEVVKSFFGLDGRNEMTFEEISQQLQLTRERVRQIKDKAIQKLKKSSSKNYLKSYLGK